MKKITLLRVLGFLLWLYISVLIHIAAIEDLSKDGNVYLQLIGCMIFTVLIAALLYIIVTMIEI